MMPDNVKVDSPAESHLAPIPPVPFVNPPASAPLAPGSVQANFQGVQASASSTVLAADDADLIEEEWIVIVKRILKEHKDDPYLMSRAMTILRADYLKKRYKKDIKIPE